MELPISVRIHNEQLGLKGTSGTLLQVSQDGYYLISTRFGDKLHKVMLPVHQTVLIFEEPEVTVAAENLEVER